MRDGLCTLTPKQLAGEVGWSGWSLSLIYLPLLPPFPSAIMGNILAKAATTDMLLQWSLFLIAVYFKTEKFYDLAGSATFLLLVTQSITSTRKFFPRQVGRSVYIGV